MSVVSGFQGVDMEFQGQNVAVQVFIFLFFWSGFYGVATWLLR